MLKSLFVSAAFAVIFGNAFCQQTPVGFSYQAAIQGESGVPIANAIISVRISILATNNTFVWQEVHNAMTNGNGIFNITIGRGSRTGGNAVTFDAIEWGEPYTIKTEVDLGNGFIEMGSSQLLSVPYAMVAMKALAIPAMQLQNLSDVDLTGLSNADVLQWNGVKWVRASLPSPDIRVKTSMELTGTGTDTDPVKLSSQSASTEDVLKWDGSKWTPSLDEGLKDVQTSNELSGDGSAANPLALSQQLATNGQVLKWSGTQWRPGDITITGPIDLDQDTDLPGAAPALSIFRHGGVGRPGIEVTSEAGGSAIIAQAQGAHDFLNAMWGQVNTSQRPDYLHHVGVMGSIGGNLNSGNLGKGLQGQSTMTGGGESVGVRGIALGEGINKAFSGRVGGPSATTMPRYGLAVEVFPGAAENYGAHAQVFSGSGNKTGFFGEVSGSFINTGSELRVNSENGTATQYGLKTNLTGSGTGQHYGIFSHTAGAGNNTGLMSTISGAGENRGIDLAVNSASGTGLQYGMYIDVNGSGAGDHHGIWARAMGKALNIGLSSTATGGINGIGMQSYASGTGFTKGIVSRVQSVSTSSQEQIGVESSAQGSGTGSHFGVRSIVASPGMNHGIYTHVTGPSMNSGVTVLTTSAANATFEQFGMRTFVGGDGMVSHYGVMSHVSGKSINFGVGGFVDAKNSNGTQQSAGVYGWVDNAKNITNTVENAAGTGGQVVGESVVQTGGHFLSKNIAATGRSYGVFASALGRGHTTAVYATSVADATYPANESMTGIHADLHPSSSVPVAKAVVANVAKSADTNYGLYSYISDDNSNSNPITNYGVYSHAGTNGHPSSVSFAGYFSGNVHVTGNLSVLGTISNPSDARLKENIKPLVSTIDKVMSLKPSEFNFKSQKWLPGMQLPEGLHFGLIAQEVELVFPSLVKKSRHARTQGIGGLTSENSSKSATTGVTAGNPFDQYRSVDYIQFITILIKAVQEQQLMIENLQQEVDKLKKEN